MISITDSGLTSDEKVLCERVWITMAWIRKACTKQRTEACSRGTDRNNTIFAAWVGIQCDVFRNDLHKELSDPDRRRRLHHINVKPSFCVTFAIPCVMHQKKDVCEAKYSVRKTYIHRHMTKCREFKRWTAYGSTCMGMTLGQCKVDRDRRLPSVFVAHPLEDLWY